MSTREMAYYIFNQMTEEQLKGFIMMFENLVKMPDEELNSRIEDIENSKNLSETFNSVAELMEDLNAED
jgi:phosphopantothenate synthetase